MQRPASISCCATMTPVRAACKHSAASSAVAQARAALRRYRRAGGPTPEGTHTPPEVSFGVKRGLGAVMCLQIGQILGVAVMRKLIETANAMVKADRTWTPEPA